MRALLRGLAAAMALLSCAAIAPGVAGASTPGPACAAGPERVGDVIVGTPCADVIHAAPGVAVVQGGGGDDIIMPGPIRAEAACPEECRLGLGSQTFEGGPGNDIVFGERGNDTLIGGEGNDQLYGGIGDDTLRGGPGNDLLSGGHGYDYIDGEAGGDYVRGDGTIDRIRDTGPESDTDTLSYSTGTTPGFGGPVPVSGFPPEAEGRGVRLDLGATGLNGDDGTAPFGGGVDEVEPGAFERIVGTPFSDYIVGSEKGETIYGGGGADVIRGEGGDDHLLGGAEGDDLVGGEGTDTLDGQAGEDHCTSSGDTVTSCELAGEAVVPRDPSKIAVGLLVPQETDHSQVYLAGSSGKDVVTATYAAGPPATVTFALGAGSTSFDESAGAAEGCGEPVAGTVICEPSAPLDSLVLAGLGGNDELSVVGFPSTVSIMLLGGQGSDRLIGGGSTEDVLVDGPGEGSDILEALGRDDALMHNGGSDLRLGGDGNDLFLSNSICDGDTLNGGAGRDNASWTKLTEPVEANLERSEAGRPSAGQTPECGGSETTDHLQQIEDLEGSSAEGAEGGDVLYGDSGENQLLGWGGADSFFAEAGDDRILANSGDADKAIDCGEGKDSALIDAGLDPAPVGCETVNGVTETLEEQLLPPAPVPPPQPADTRPPQTRIRHRPAKLVRTEKARRRVSFRFTSEAGARFRCELDGRGYSGCSSPRAYRVGRGPHVFRVFAIDAAGNRDRSPALFRFRVKRISGR